MNAQHETDAGTFLRPPATTLHTVVRAGHELSPAELAGWRADGLIIAVAGGVYLLADLAGDPCHRAAALALLLPPRGVAAGLAAAWVHGAGGPVDPVDVLVPPGTGPAATAVPGTRVSTERLAPHDMVRVAGVPVTSPARTAADLARRDPADAPVLAALLSAGARTDDVLAALAGRRNAERGRRALAAALSRGAGPAP